MEAVHSETRRLLVTARGQLEALEHAASKGLDPAASDAVLQSYRETVRGLGEATERLRGLAGRRAVWQARVRDLDDQLMELRSADSRIVTTFRKLRREALVESTNRRGGDVALALGPMSAAEEARSLERSTTSASGILATGGAVVRELLSQRRTLKNAKTKMLSVLNQMGVDRRIIQQIERRDNADRLLLYAGMAVLLIILFLAYCLKLYLIHRHDG